MKHRFWQKILAALVSCSMILSNVAVAEADTVEIDVDTADEIEVTDISDEVEQMIEECVEAEGIAVDVQHFPDEQFRSYISQYLDLNHDGKLSSEERAISSLSVPSMEIEELTGIEYFTDLKELDCSENPICFFDVSSNAALEKLNCSGMANAKLDLSANKKLKELKMGQNMNLIEANLSGLTLLEKLDCSSIMTERLDLSTLKNLSELTMKECGFETLIFPNNSKLRILDLQGTLLLDSNLASQTNLEELNLQSSMMDVLDISGMAKLKKLNCYETMLYYVNVSAQNRLEDVESGNNMYYIEGSEVDFRNFTGFSEEHFRVLENGKLTNGVLTAEGEEPVVYAFDIPVGGGYHQMSIQMGFGNEITEKMIPDANFRKYVMDYCDMDEDGVVRAEELSLVVGLSLGELGIKDLKGIEYFTNLQYLYCEKNQISRVDLSKNTCLEEISIYDNQLKSLDLSKLPNLSYLDCRFNNLDVSKVKLPSSLEQKYMTPQKSYKDIQVKDGYLPFSLLDGYVYDPNSHLLNIEGGTLSSNEKGIRLNQAVGQQEIRISLSLFDWENVIGTCTVKVNSVNTVPTVATPKLLKVSSDYRNRIYWNQVKNASGYRVYRKKEGSSSWTIIENTSAAAYRYTDSNAVPGQTYIYTVRAKTILNGKTIWSGFDPKGLKAKASIKTPVLKSAKAVAYNKIQVTWEAVSGATAYRVYRKTAGGGWKSVAYLRNSVSSFGDTGIVTGASYTYTVRACRKINGKNYYGGYDKKGKSATASLSAGNLISTKTQSGKQTIEWKKISGASGYQLQYASSASAAFHTLKTVNASDTSYTYKVSSTTMKRYYRVRAYRVVDKKTGKKVYGAFSKAKSMKEIEKNGSSITLNASCLNLPVKGVRYLTCSVKPQDASVSDIKWTSSNTSVAKVTQSGKVTGIREGTATIKASYPGNGVYASCKIVVYDIPSKAEYDFSEYHMGMATGEGAPYGFDRDMNEGGDAMKAIAYLARWEGVVSEYRDPYPAEDYLCEYHDMEEEYHVQDIYFIPAKQSPLDNDEIKKAVMNYGAVYATYLNGSDYFNDDQTNYCYKPEENPYDPDEPVGSSGSFVEGHAVAIVGWDDNYPKESFRYPPEGDGAFICKNSWGEEFGENGYFYISYYDAYLGSRDINTVCPKMESRKNYGGVYQYDPMGATVTYGYDKQMYQANVFPKKGSATSTSQDLQAVSFYTYDAGYRYEIYVVKNYKDKNSLKNLGTPVKTGTMEYAGYHTVPLKDSVKISAGTRFAVVVKLMSDGQTQGYFEAPIEGNSSAAFSGYDESFVSHYGTSWWDINDYLPNTNACIKAFMSGEVKNVMVEEAVGSSQEHSLYQPEELLEKGFELNPDYLEEQVSLGTSISTAGTGDSSTGAGTTVYPSRYDLREQGRISSVKNQSSRGLCWTFAMYASLESCMMK